MITRCLAVGAADQLPAEVNLQVALRGGPDYRWVWIDIETQDADLASLSEFSERLGLDSLALHDVVSDRDLPKLDDFGTHLLVVLHGLSDQSNQLATHEVDCFLTAQHLITFRAESSPSIDALYRELLVRAGLAAGGPDELLARLFDIVTRRVLGIIDSFEERVDELADQALEASPDFLVDLTAVRGDLTELRRIVHPQREVFDQLKQSDSRLLSAGSRRRFADVFDVALRTAHGLELVRAGLSEALDAYRGAEARRAADVSTVLTVYAAIMLPLSLVVGFFGMNHQNLPTVADPDGWKWIVAGMTVLLAVSFAVFVKAGWVRMPFRPKAVGRGIASVSSIPVRLVDSLYQAAKSPGSRRVAKGQTK